MQLGMIELDRMGASMVRRLLRVGHACVVRELQPSAVAGVVKEGAAGAASLEEMVTPFGRPRTIWLMVPAAVVDRTFGDLVSLLESGDIVVDGGNSFYGDDMRRGMQLQGRGILYLDVGTSGGVAGVERGYCLMIAVNGVWSSIRGRSFCLCRRVSTRQRGTPGRKAGTAGGFLHCGLHGAGHFDVVFLFDVDNPLHTACSTAMLVGDLTNARSAGRDERNPA